MLSLARATCLILATAIVVPGLAQEGPATRIEFAKVSKRLKPQPRSSVIWECGAYFRCFSGIPLQCTEQTRPYQNIAAHQCFCIHEGCPQ